MQFGMPKLSFHVATAYDSCATMAFRLASGII